MSFWEKWRGRFGDVTYRLFHGVTPLSTSPREPMRFHEPIGGLCNIAHVTQLCPIPNQLRLGIVPKNSWSPSKNIAVEPVEHEHIWDCQSLPTHFDCSNSIFTGEIQSPCWTFGYSADKKGWLLGAPMACSQANGPSPQKKSGVNQVNPPKKDTCDSVREKT